MKSASIARMERSEIPGGIDASRQSRITLRSIRATELKIASPRKQKTWMAGSSPAMTPRVVACESFLVKTYRDEPSLGSVGRDLTQQNQH
jgi:hypothetical protein